MNSNGHIHVRVDLGPAERRPRLVDYAVEQLAAIAEGLHYELRVRLHQDARGRSSLDVRVWHRDDDGTVWPTKHGLRVHEGQINEFSAAIARAAELANQRARKPR